MPLLLIVPRPEITTALTLGLALSLAALWATPHLGKIEAGKISKAWPYLPALAATATLVGIPFGLNWPVWATFSTGFAADLSKSIIVILALMLALSGLARYGLNLWQGEQPFGKQLWLIPTIAAIVAAIPFLIPGLAPFMLAAIMPTGLPAVSSSNITTLVLIFIATAGAIGLGYFRTPIIVRLSLPTTELVKILDLQWLLVWLEKSLSRVSKFILRVNVILEGQHYLGWALLTALVGSLIIILTRGT